MRPVSSRSRCLLSRKTAARTLSSSRVERFTRWPAGGAAARVHRGRVTTTRPLFARSSRAPSRPHALSRRLQVDVSTSTTTDHSKHPRPPESVVGAAAWHRKLPFAPRTTARASQGQGPRTPCLGSPRRDCSRRRLRPDPDRSGHLLSRGPLFFPVRRDAGKGRSRRRVARLHGARHGRVVRRLPSAKRGDVHQPEGPSVQRLHAVRAGECRRAGQDRASTTTSAFFTTGRHARGTLARAPEARPRGMESDESPAYRLTAAPLWTSTFE